MENKESTHVSEKLRRRARYEAVFAGLLIASALIVILNINIGSVPIPVSEIARILFRRTGDLSQVNIIWRIRMPRIITVRTISSSLMPPLSLKAMTQIGV